DRNVRRDFRSAAERAHDCRAGGASGGARRRVRRCFRRHETPAGGAQSGSCAVRYGAREHGRGRVLSTGDGRMTTIRIQTEDFDAGAEIAALTKGNASVGAVASFVGVVRGDDGLTALTLEHYPAMTGGEIGKIAAEAQQRWPLQGITIIHRTGRLVVG